MEGILSAQHGDVLPIPCLSSAPRNLFWASIAPARTPAPDDGFGDKTMRQQVSEEKDIVWRSCFVREEMNTEREGVLCRSVAVIALD
ncbi:hypothetical protein RRG08_044012 [Elysia crispata]|uniref:Uncharacterized protein n=1 Tax=Elysia crispata TaxID=231223 RepID=A0AAE0Y1A8_9GAST|nr:hypothetical protein RRG08_044012 [Elysia crispata]